MSRWFLSYHSPGQPLTERVKAAIERKARHVDVAVGCVSGTTIVSGKGRFHIGLVPASLTAAITAWTPFFSMFASVSRANAVMS
jgi:hypothetical protein